MKDKITDKEFKRKLYEHGNGEYIALEPYINDHTNIKVKHLKCGHIYSVRPNNFFQGKRCPKCSGLLKKNEKDIQNFLDERFPGEFLVIGKYKNKDTPIKVKHLTCGHIITPTWNNIRGNKFSCKYCNQSNGSLAISKILDEMKVNYEREVMLEDCKDIKYLPFDFYIELNNEIYLIEYDGRQHFLPIFGYSKKERIKELNKTKRHDKIKDKFCEEHDVHFLRISYKEKDVKTLIEKFLFE